MSGQQRATAAGAAALGAALGLLLLGFGLAGWPPTARAAEPGRQHKSPTNDLTSSIPAASATVTTPPERITLFFRWRVRPGSAMVTVVGPDGTSQWQRDRAGAVDRSIGIDLRHLVTAGQYQVHYRGVSLRGHPFQGMIEFVLAPRIAALNRTADQVPPLWITGAVLLTVTASAAGIRLGRAGL
jgi:hypothetical protein